MEVGVTEQTPEAEKVCYLGQVCPNKFDSEGSCLLSVLLTARDDVIMVPEIKNVTVHSDKVICKVTRGE